MEPLSFHVLDQNVVDPFHANRLRGEDIGDVIGGAVHVRVSEDDERSCRRTLDESHGRLEDRDTGSFAANECAGDVEAILGEQLIEIITRDAARNLWEPRANE